MPDLNPAILRLTLYGPNDEVSGEYQRSRISWGVLKQAVRLSKMLDQRKAEEMEEGDIDAIGQLVVEAFGGQFTTEDLDAGADIGEMIAVIQAIVARAGALVAANPTPPSATLPKGKAKR